MHPPPKALSSWRQENEDLEDEFVAVEIVGKGTYATVYKAYRKSNPKKYLRSKKWTFQKKKRVFQSLHFAKSPF
jgi:hypothetical protein